MMEGVVLYGTGKQAQLNGYSSAEKPAQRRRSIRVRILFEDHACGIVRRHRASEQSGDLGSVVLDKPKGASYYGGGCVRAGVCGGRAAGP